MAGKKKFVVSKEKAEEMAKPKDKKAPHRSATEVRNKMYGSKKEKE